MKTTTYLRIATVAGLCTLASMPTVLLAATSSKQWAAAKEAERFHHERGTIKSVDANLHAVVIVDQKDNSDHKFSWNDQTKFTVQGKPASASDLKPGERIHLTYQADGEMPAIQRAQILPDKMEKNTPAHS